MKNSRFETLALAIIAGAVVYWMTKSDNKTPVTNIVSGSAMPNRDYNVNPQQAGYNPALAPQPINVVVQNQGMGYLDNSVFPMFGFVGIAQGEVYH